MSLKNWVFIAVIYHLIWWDSDHNTWFNFLLFPPLFLNRIDGNIINVSTLLRYLKPALYLDTHLHTQKYTNKRLSLIYSSLLQQATTSCTSWRSFHSFKCCTVNGTKFISSWFDICCFLAMTFQRNTRQQCCDWHCFKSTEGSLHFSKEFALFP